MYQVRLLVWISPSGTFSAYPFSIMIRICSTYFSRISGSFNKRRLNPIKRFSTVFRLFGRPGSHVSMRTVTDNARRQTQSTVTLMSTFVCLLSKEMRQCCQKCSHRLQRCPRAHHFHQTKTWLKLFPIQRGLQRVQRRNSNHFHFRRNSLNRTQVQAVTSQEGCEQHRDNGHYL